MASDLILEILGAFLGVGKATGCVTGGGPGIEVEADRSTPRGSLDNFGDNANSLLLGLLLVDPKRQDAMPLEVRIERDRNRVSLFQPPLVSP